jgi:hypothetical protein
MGSARVQLTAASVDGRLYAHVPGVSEVGALGFIAVRRKIGALRRFKIGHLRKFSEGPPSSNCFCYIIGGFICPLLRVTAPTYR